MSYSLTLDKIKILVPNADDPEVEQIHLWMKLAIRSGYGEGKEMVLAKSDMSNPASTGPTWSLRDFLRVIQQDAPRAFMELTRVAEERELTGECYPRPRRQSFQN